MLSWSTAHVQELNRFCMFKNEVNCKQLKEMLIKHNFT